MSKYLTVGALIKTLTFSLCIVNPNVGVLLRECHFLTVVIQLVNHREVDKQFM